MSLAGSPPPAGAPPTTTTASTSDDKDASKEDSMPNFLVSQGLSEVFDLNEDSGTGDSQGHAAPAPPASAARDINPAWFASLPGAAATAAARDPDLRTAVTARGDLSVSLAPADPPSSQNFEVRSLSQHERDSVDSPVLVSADAPPTLTAVGSRSGSRRSGSRSATASTPLAAPVPLPPSAVVPGDGSSQDFSKLMDPPSFSQLMPSQPTAEPMPSQPTAEPMPSQPTAEPMPSQLRRLDEEEGDEPMDMDVVKTEPGLDTQPMPHTQTSLRHLPAMQFDSVPNGDDAMDTSGIAPPVLSPLTSRQRRELAPGPAGSSIPDSCFGASLPRAVSPMDGVVSVAPAAESTAQSPASFVATPARVALMRNHDQPFSPPPPPAQQDGSDQSPGQQAGDEPPNPFGTHLQMPPHLAPPSVFASSSTAVTANGNGDAHGIPPPLPPPHVYPPPHPHHLHPPPPPGHYHYPGAQTGYPPPPPALEYAYAAAAEYHHHHRYHAHAHGHPLPPPHLLDGGYPPYDYPPPPPPHGHAHPDHRFPPTGLPTAPTSPEQWQQMMQQRQGYYGSRGQVRRRDGQDGAPPPCGVESEFGDMGIVDTDDLSSTSSSDVRVAVEAKPSRRRAAPAASRASGARTTRAAGATTTTTTTASASTSRRVSRRGAAAASTTTTAATEPSDPPPVLHRASSGASTATTAASGGGAPETLIPSTTKKSTTHCKSLPPVLAYPAHLIPIDAPIQSKSNSPATSAGAAILPSVILQAPTKRKRGRPAKSQLTAAAVPAEAAAVGDGAEDGGGVDLESVDPRDLKRLKNTLSARKSRARKAAKIDYLEHRVNELEAENERLRELMVAAGIQPPDAIVSQPPAEDDDDE
ncbi:hypothetical protein H9P43_005035 [Blastocladiella emersonii ATCC 22665]|nr:hypothetical protein H9P43_005035 [Blastocladiella emersonii ATCC 22665]